MARYRDEVVRVNLRQVAATFPPRVFAGLTTVELQHAGVATEVTLTRAPGAGCVGLRAWFQCPRCHRPFFNAFSWASKSLIHLLASPRSSIMRSHRRFF